MQRFVVNTTSTTDSSCVIAAGDCRVSVLSDRLIRVEKGAFCDHATQTVWYRDFDRPHFWYDQQGKTITVKTDKCVFVVDSGKGKVVSVTLENGAVVTDFKKGNLKGTCRTLDGVNGKTALQDGLLSLNGVTVVDDSASLILNGDKIEQRPDKKHTDLYYFAYGNDYRACIYDFYRLTGFTPLIPKYTLGNWWSRYKAYTQEEYRSLMQRFIDEQIPVTVATIDMDWHWVDVIERFGEKARPVPTDNDIDRDIFCKYLPGWTGYSWNTELFPDYRELLNWLHANNFAVTLNVHPSHGVRFFEDQYKAVCETMGVDPSTEQPILFKLGDEKFLKAYFDILHHPYEKEGVDFWWLDWQQGENSDVKNLDPLWALNHYHSMDIANSGKRQLILSRYAGLGSHRYPLGFSGDTYTTWASLKFQPYFTNNAANVGYSWWSHDIGGHQKGTKDDELYLRWIQYGVFSPINRLHSCSNEFMGKEPWKVRGYIGELATRYLRLRHRLVPYLYSCNYMTHTEGRALCEPMYYSYKEDAAYQCPNQYMFGTQLMVCPITDKTDPKTALAKQDLWVPQGRYTDIFNGRIYHGGHYTVFRGVETLPVLAREGAIIPLYHNDTTNDLSLSQPLDIWIYRGNGSFDMYEDDGVSNDYQHGKYFISHMSVVENGNTLTFTINTDGDKSILPATRTLYLCFRDVQSAQVTVNGEHKGDYKDSIEVQWDNGQLGVVLTDVVARTNKPYREACIDLISSYQTESEPKADVFKGVIDSLDSELNVEDRYKLPIQELRDIAKRQQ